MTLTPNRRRRDPFAQAHHELLHADAAIVQGRLEAAEAAAALALARLAHTTPEEADPTPDEILTARAELRARLEAFVQAEKDLEGCVFADDDAVQAALIARVSEILGKPIGLHRDAPARARRERIRPDAADQADMALQAGDPARAKRWDKLAARLDAAWRALTAAPDERAGVIAEIEDRLRRRQTVELSGEEGGAFDRPPTLP